MADVSAIIVNFNSGEFLAPCLESIRREAAAGLSLELLIVENASTIDQSRHFRDVERLGPRVVRSDRNLGYGGGCNLGLRETTGRFVLFLNADVKACAGCLAPMMQFLDDHADVAFVEPRTYADDALTFLIPEIEELTPTAILRDVGSHWSRAAAHRSSLRRARAALSGWRAAAPREQATLTGAFLMARRATIESLRGFDENYPLYFEDADLFRRARRKGLRLAMLPQARAIHYAHRSAATVWTDAMAKYRVGRRRWLRTSFGTWAVALDAACEVAIRVAQATRGEMPARGFDELGPRGEPPDVPLDGAGPFLLELAIDPVFRLAAAHFGDGARFRFPDAAWKSLLDHRYFLRALDPTTLAPLGAWTFEKRTTSTAPDT